MNETASGKRPVHSAGDSVANNSAGDSVANNSAGDSVANNSAGDSVANNSVGDSVANNSAGVDKSRCFPDAFQGHSTDCYPDFHFGNFHDDSSNLEAGFHSMPWCQAGPDSDKFHKEDLCADRTAAQVGRQNAGHLIGISSRGHMNLDLLRNYHDIGPRIDTAVDYKHFQMRPFRGWNV